MSHCRFSVFQKITGTADIQVFRFSGFQPLPKKSTLGCRQKSGSFYTGYTGQNLHH
jgi:hypothetical protein